MIMYGVYNVAHRVRTFIAMIVAKNEKKLSRRIDLNMHHQFYETVV